jgi:hypothetical protein
MNKVVPEQFKYVESGFRTRRVTFEQLREAARTVVRDPMGILRGSEAK